MNYLNLSKDIHLNLSKSDGVQYILTLLIPLFLHRIKEFTLVLLRKDKILALATVMFFS